MGRKAVHTDGILIDKIVKKQSNGDRYVYRRTRVYNPGTQSYEKPSTVLLGKMKDGSDDKEDLLPTRPKRSRKGDGNNSQSNDAPSLCSASKRHTGMIDIINHIARISGISNSIHDILPDEKGLADKILTCTYYRFATDADSWTGVNNWSTKYAGQLPYIHGPITKDVYGDLFKEIGRREEIKQNLFKKQTEGLSDAFLLAIDSSTFESESEDQTVARKAVHKDKIVKPVYKIQYFYAIEYRKPIAYSVLPGNIPDSSTLKNALTQIKILGFDQAEIVTDNGYCAESAIAMYVEKNQPFLTRAEADLKWISSLIDEERESIQYSGDILSCDPKFCGVKKTIKKAFHFAEGETHSKDDFIEAELNVFIYFSSVNMAKDDVYFRTTYSHYREDLLYGRVLGDDKAKIESFAKKYMIIDRDQSGEIISICPNQEAQKKKLKYSGYLVLISNKETNLDTALKNFRCREYIEEDIKNYKSHIGGKKGRVWYDDNLDGEVFVQFLSLCMHESFEAKVKSVNRTLAVTNGEAEHDKSATLKLEKQLSNWISKNSLHNILNWFDAIETKTVTEVNGKHYTWKTETTKRDEMFLEKLGINDVAIEKTSNEIENVQE